MRESRTIGVLPTASQTESRIASCPVVMAAAIL